MKNAYRFFICLTVIIGLLFIGVRYKDDISTSSFKTNTIDDVVPQRELLQFISSGHVLGFKPKSLYISNSSYMLKEEFVGTKGAIPFPEAEPTVGKQAQGLNTVIYHELWSGVTLKYDKPQGGIIRSTYFVEAGADPNQIRLKYNVPLTLSNTGNLIFEFDSGMIQASEPIAWQEIDGRRVSIDIAYEINQQLSEVSFSIDDYNSDYPLIIDPTLTWNVFFGSSYFYGANSIALDNRGNIYITGVSNNVWGNPIEPFTPGSTVGGKRASDVFVAKINSDGDLLWNTFIGSSNSDSGGNIALDESGNVYITGISLATWGNPINSHTVDDWSGAGTTPYDTFVAKLNQDGILQWNTFMGPAIADYSRDIVLDEDGSIYLTGSSIVDWETSEIFIAKLNNKGIILWNSYLSSCGKFTTTSGSDLELGSDGDLYITGTTECSWGNPIKPFSPGNDPNWIGHWTSDAFVAKLNSKGAILWNTFLGTTGMDTGSSIVLDNRGDIYISGNSEAVWGTPINDSSGGTNAFPYNDAFIAKFDRNGSLQWNTFVGGTGDDVVSDITVGDSGSIFLVGSSHDTWGDSDEPFSYGTDSSGNTVSDVFVAKLGHKGTLEWNTFKGSSNRDRAGSIAVGENGKLYITGQSYAVWGSPLHTFPRSESYDPYGFLAVLGSENINIDNIFPEDRAINASVESSIKVTFSKPMKESTISNRTFLLDDGEVPGRVSYDPDSYTATFAPDTKLKFSEEYTATLNTDITDESGNSLSESFSWSFTTIQKQSALINRVNLILDAIDNYYNLFTLPDNFPKSIIQAIVAQETGRYFDFNNEVVADDWGRGIMQITTNGFVGSGSEGCEDKECLQCKKRQSREACKVYYSNTQKGFDRNVRDGLYALDEKYGIADYCANVQGHGSISPEEICWMSIVQRYNTGGNIPTEYLWDVGSRLQRLKYNWYELERVEDQTKLGDKFQTVYAKNVRLESPAILRVYNSQGQATGIIGNEVREEIPNSIYDADEEVAIFLFPTETYRYQVVGSEKGDYGLIINFAQNEGTSSFRGIDIPISPNAIHQYTIDWESLAVGEKGVTIKIDSNGNGEFEKTIKANDEITADKFQKQRFLSINNSSNILSLMGFIIVILLVGFIMARALWRSK